MSSAPATVDVATVVARVTVFEDRADVVREASVTLPAGACTITVRRLPAVLSDAHVTARLETTGKGAPAHVHDVRVQRRLVTGDDTAAARRADHKRLIEALDDEVRAADQALRGWEDAFSAVEIALNRWVGQASAAAGRGDGTPAQWDAGAAAFERELDVLVAKRSDARAVLDDARRRRAKAADPDGRPAPTGQRTEAELVLRVSSGGGPMKLVVGTLVPCAAWRPSHEAQLVLATPINGKPGGGVVRFVTSASVWNRTGESWEGVPLSLSTARPSAGAQLPPLRADRLTLRPKTAEEKRTIVVEHREESVPRPPSGSSAPPPAAPGVDDGGEPRVYAVAEMTVPDDGRPHAVEIARFEAPCITERVAFPELVPQVFLRATLKNPTAEPILAGPVTLVAFGAWVGTGDVLYVGAGDTFELSFGSDDRFLVRSKRRRVEDRKLVGKDVVHFVRETVLSHAGTTTERVLVQMRLPVSELKQLRVVPSPHLCSDELTPDEHGVVKLAVELAPHVERKVVLAFTFDAQADVRVPDPW